MSDGYYCPWCEHTSTLAETCRGKICCIKCGKPINSRMGKLLKKTRAHPNVKIPLPINVRDLARFLDCSSNWASQVMKALGWRRRSFPKRATFYTPPKVEIEA